MRRARLTFLGAFHHCVNRGHNGEPILAGDGAKVRFLEILAEACQKLRIRLFAYCLLDNHYHLILENSTGRLADFFKHVNGEFGSDFRRRFGGKGYVFQGRYYSTLIQDDSYLLQAISYVLSNPVQAGLVADPFTYRWSSIDAYFGSDAPDWLANVFVESLYGSKREMRVQLYSWGRKGASLPLLQIAMGPIIGTLEGMPLLRDKSERRSGKESQDRRRKEDFGFEPLDRIYQEFFQAHGLDLAKLDFSSRQGKALRRELLVTLRDCGGISYREIATLPEFLALSVNSLSRLYQFEKRRS